MLKFSTTFEKNSIDSIAIGGFDGLHKAHQHLLSHLGEHGAVLVIEKHFTHVLTPKMQRCKYTSYPCLFLDFTAIKDMEALAFVHYLKDIFPSLKKIVVGYDFRFGKNRGGDAVVLRRLQNVEVLVIKEQKIDGVSIHAREIKRLLTGGAIEYANKLLGREYSIEGEVISGQGLGKKALYPTLNLDIGEFLLPKEGVYICRAKIEDTYYPALTFIGKRYSTDCKFSIEVHILNETFFGYVKSVEIIFLSYMRENRKFNTLDLLKKQISKDIDTAKCYFEKAM